MHGLCGWFGGHVGNPIETLDHMAGALPSPAAGAFDWRAETERGLCGAGVSCRFETGAGLWAAIDGTPYWTDETLAALAASQGHGAALVQAYRTRGRDLFDVLHGPFALALFDGANHRALIAIDRMGIHPMCFAQLDDGIVFATTTSSVRSDARVRTSLNHQALYDYLFFTRVPAPETVFNEISKLKPGHAVWFERGQANVHAYWRPEYCADRAADVDELAEELQTVLARAVRRAADNAVPGTIGSYLSGGIDSSTVTGHLAAVCNKSAPAFTVGFGEADFDELAFSRGTARHFGVPLNEYVVTPSDIADFAPKLGEIYDEPFGNTSAVAAYYCARMAAEHGTTTLLAGDGGDELFAGNTRYADQKLFEAYGRIPAWLRKFLIEPLLHGVPGGDGIAPIHKARRYIRRAKIPLPDRMESYHPLYGEPASLIFASDIAAQIDVEQPLQIMRSHYNAPKADTALDRMLYLDLCTVIADDDVRKVQRTAELTGVTVRFPMLDDELMAFSTRVPAGVKMKGRALRHFFKYAMRDFLPAATLSKKKQGFSLPFGVWLRTDTRLQALAHDNIEALKTRAIFRPDFLDKAIADHGSGHDTFHGEGVWLLTILELWLAHQAESGQARAGLSESRGAVA